jgi:hypothetical protein
MGEAEETKRQFEEAWRYADSELKFSRMDEQKRKNIAIRIDEKTPNDLIYIAGTFCKK